MTNIKASRKGLRLNDARYFRLPLPHMRKRMTLMRIMPRISNSQSGRFHVVQDSASVNPGFGIGTKLPDRSKTVESKQSSTEVALVTCRDFEDNDQNKKGCQDICVETEAIEPSGNLPSSTEQENVLALVRGDSEKSAKFPQVEDIHRETVWKMVRNKKLPGQMERNCRSVDRKQNGDRDDEAKEKEKCSSWWKDGGQTVLQFFAKILGKRGGMGTKGPTDHVLPIDKRSRKRVERVSRDGQGHNRQRRGADGGSIRLKRVNNGYIADYTCRNEGNWRDTATENKSREEQQRPSILVRQIQQTRDKSLRVMLLERELRRRLPKTTKRDTHLIANGVVNIRRLSNPLC